MVAFLGFFVFTAALEVETENADKLVEEFGQIIWFGWKRSKGTEPLMSILPVPKAIKCRRQDEKILAVIK